MVNLIPCVARVANGVRKTILRAASGKKYLITGKFFVATSR